MCLGVPGKISRVWTENGAPWGEADFAGEHRRVCLAYLPDLTPGDYVIMHMGFAITRVEESTALETMQTMREYGVLDAIEVMTPRPVSP